MKTRAISLGLMFLAGLSALLPTSLPARQFTQSAGPESSDLLPQVNVTAQSSIRLTFDFNIPELQIENPEIVRATCVSPNEINLTGVRPGVTTLTVSDPNKKLHTITVNVAIDTRKLELTLRQYFTDSSVHVTPLQTGVLLTGHVARAEDVNNVLAVSRDFFPTGVVNQLRVDGSQVVATEVRVYEVSRTKLRRLGIDWAVFGDRGRIVNGFSDLIANVNDLTTAQGNFTASVFDDANGITAVLNALEQKNVARLMTQPTLVSTNGRPAELLSGGEIPIQVNAGLGQNSIQFRAFGTRLDVVPLVHGQGDLTLEVRAEVSEVAPELAGDTGVPGFRVRRVNTSAPMRAGQTLVLAGVYSENSSGESRGAPGLVNKPLVGAFFRNVNNQSNETELVFILTPRTVAPVDANSLTGPFPGRSTTDPSNHQLFINGHIEVPKCGNDCHEHNPYLANPSLPVMPSSPAPEAPGLEAPASQDLLQGAQYRQPAPPQQWTVPPTNPDLNPAVPASNPGFTFPAGRQLPIHTETSASDADYFRQNEPESSAATSGFGFPQPSNRGTTILQTAGGSSRSILQR